MGVRLTGMIVVLGVQIQGVPEVGVGFRVAAQQDVGVGEVAVGVGLRGQVVQQVGDVQSGLPGEGEVVPVPLPSEKRVQGPGKLPRVGIEPGLGGLPDSGEQHGMFDCQPGHR
jgi:hypothetical protein